MTRARLRFRARRAGETCEATTHLLGLLHDHDDVSRSHGDLAVFGVDGVEKLELEIVTMLLLRAVRARHGAEGENALVREVHLGRVSVGALDGDEDAIFSLRPKHDGRSVLHVDGDATTRERGVSDYRAKLSPTKFRVVRAPRCGRDECVGSSNVETIRNRKRLPASTFPPFSTSDHTFESAESVRAHSGPRGHHGRLQGAAVRREVQSPEVHPRVRRRYRQDPHALGAGPDAPLSSLRCPPRRPPLGSHPSSRLACRSPLPDPTIRHRSAFGYPRTPTPTPSSRM